MSKGILISAVCVVAMLVASVSVAGQPSASKMRQMGLYGVPVVSDAVAMEVRGMGYQGGGRRGGDVQVWGESKVKVSYYSHGVYASAESKNGYDAEGDHFAIGANVSAATVLVPKKHHRGNNDTPEPLSVNSTPGGGGHTSLKPVAVAVAGGISVAYAR